MGHPPFVLVVLLAVGAALGGPRNAILDGVVTDSEGVAIRGAHVIVRWDSSGSGAGLKSNVGLRHDLSIETDAKGRFASELPPGFYDVFVSANAFSPECRKLRITAGETATYNATLRVDPLVMKELGDRIPER